MIVIFTNITKLKKKKKKSCLLAGLFFLFFFFPKFSDIQKLKIFQKLEILFKFTLENKNFPFWLGESKNWGKTNHQQQQWVNSFSFFSLKGFHLQAHDIQMCRVRIEEKGKAQTATPTWQAVSSPKSSSLAKGRQVDRNFNESNHLPLTLKTPHHYFFAKYKRTLSQAIGTLHLGKSPLESWPNQHISQQPIMWIILDKGKGRSWKNRWAH